MDDGTKIAIVGRGCVGIAAGVAQRPDETGPALLQRNIVGHQAGAREQ